MRVIDTTHPAIAAPPQLSSFPLDERWRVSARLRLTAIGVAGKPRLSVWFKDRTNGVTTYGGYRTIRPLAVQNGGWTVLDFNFAYTPPCACSDFTTCPLAPPENRLPVAIEAGLKQRPRVKGR